MYNWPKNKQKGGKEIDERGKAIWVMQFQSIQVDFIEMPRVG